MGIFFLVSGTILWKKIPGQTGFEAASNLQVQMFAKGDCQLKQRYAQQCCNAKESCQESIDH
jgi:hypothetical protein